MYFWALLSKDKIDAAIRDAKGWFQGWVYSGSVTMWVILAQCLSADHSCKDSVAGLIAWLVRNGRKPCSADTSAYCTARDHLPEKACRELAIGVGQELDQAAPQTWLWKARRVIFGDGSTFTMADTEAIVDGRRNLQQPSGHAGTS